jgi:uncharacterized membrane protein YcfT
MRAFVRRIELRIARTRRWHTKVLERFVLALTKAMTMLDVSRLLGVGRDVVKDFKRHLHRCFGRPRITSLEYIAIDKRSVCKGHKYLMKLFSSYCLKYNLYH